jgi:hypothetical protein
LKSRIFDEAVLIKLNLRRLHDRIRDDPALSAGSRRKKNPRQRAGDFLPSTINL